MQTLQELCAQYLCAREYELDDSTKATARLACRWFDAGPAACPLLRIDRAAGDRFKNWLVATGRAPTTANMYLRAIKPILRYGVELGLWPDHPWRQVRQLGVMEKPVTIYEDAQFERMLFFLPKPTADDPQRDLRWLAILWGGRTTGFRRGALLNLTWENIRGGLVWCEPKKQTDRTWPWVPKTRRIYKVPLAPQFARALEPLRDRRYPLVHPAIARRLIAGDLAGRWRKCPEFSFGRTFVGIQRRAFGRQVNDFHGLRRTFTTDLAERLPDRAVMELTNHTRRETLNRYTAVRPSHWSLAYEIIASIGKRASATALDGLPVGPRGPEMAL
jgi:integrase